MTENPPKSKSSVTLKKVMSVALWGWKSCWKGSRTNKEEELQSVSMNHALKDIGGLVCFL